MVSPSPKDKNVGDEENPTDLDIIRLQLRKPKSWNWQLTTSKSSPHVTLPTVQLLDYKGRLLVEAHDDWNVQWKVWKTGDSHRPYNLKKSRSDTVARNILSPSNKHQEQINIGCAVKTRKEVPLTKCCSEMIGNRIGYNGYGPTGLVRNSSAPPGHESRHHQRSRSDDLFLRRLKHSSEESIRRAELDGYRRFIKPHLSESQKEPDSQQQPKTKSKRRNGLIQSTEDGIFQFNGKAQQPEVTDIQHKRYKTRTSSAGTLVIEETFRNPNHRRRRRTTELEAPREEHESHGREFDFRSARSKTIKDGLFYSRSEVFPFERVLAHMQPDQVSDRSNGVRRSSSEIETIQNGHRRRKTRPRRSCSSDLMTLEGKTEGRGRNTGK
nr:unnamed protein product [Callosobruchus chinensis]